MIPVFTSSVRGRSSDWIIVRMCVEGTKVESSVIWAYYTARNALIEIANKFYLVDA